MERRLRFADLVALGLFNNRNTLKNWIRDYGFPCGQLTGPNTRTWGEGEVEAYIKTRLTAPKWYAVARKPRGRPRKHFIPETPAQPPK